MTTVLVTGAAGEVGHALLPQLSKLGYKVIAFDIKSKPPDLDPALDWIVGNIADLSVVKNIFSLYQIDIVFHLAAILSSGGEENPSLTHSVNVDGTLNLLETATHESINRGIKLKFILPSSIAVYGMPSLEEKNTAGKVREDQYLDPITMYGVNKVYGEYLGKYYSKNYQLLADIDRNNFIDFRSVRFPGLISAETVPSGGTTDYGPEMIHAAKAGKPYKCFVRKDSCLPFMAMPDAVGVLVKLMDADREKLTKEVYNVGAFSISAEQIAQKVKLYYPEANITYEINAKRQQIVDSWPADVDDSLARKDWGWKPEYDFDKTFEEYLNLKG